MSTSISPPWMRPAMPIGVTAKASFLGKSISRCGSESADVFAVEFWDVASIAEAEVSLVPCKGEVSIAFWRGGIFNL